MPCRFRQARRHLAGTPSRPPAAPAAAARFTLVELLAAMAITALVMGILTGVFISSLRAWQRASSDVALVATGDDTMRKLVTGIGLRGSELGIQDALAVLQATPHQVVLLPAWRQVHVVDERHVIDLDPPFQPGAAPPLAFRIPGRVPFAVDVDADGHQVGIPRSIPTGSRVELYYRPRAGKRTAHLVLALDRSRQRVLRAYGGSSRLLPAGRRGVRITDLRFRYFLTGREDTPVASLSENLQQVRGIGVTMFLRLRDRVHEVRRVIDLRNATSSILVTAPARNIAMLPPPDRIRVFEMRYFAGAEIGGRIELRAGPWSCKMQMIAHDTALVTMTADGLGTRQVTVHTAFGVGFLNPDLVLDTDGADTPGRGDLARTMQLKPGFPVIPLGPEAGVRYLDRNHSGTYNIGESIFIDTDLNGRLDAGDRLLLGGFEAVNAPARVLSGKTDSIAYHDARNAKHFDDGEDLVIDGDGDGVFGGPFYDCCGAEQGSALSVTAFTIKGASIIIR